MLAPAPPVTDIRLRSALGPTKNPTHSPSGEKNGLDPRAWSSMGTSDCCSERTVSGPLDSAWAMRVPSGEIATTLPNEL